MTRTGTRAAALAVAVALAGCTQRYAVWVEGRVVRARDAAAGAGVYAWAARAADAPGDLLEAADDARQVDGARVTCRLVFAGAAAEPAAAAELPAFRQRVAGFVGGAGRGAPDGLLLRVEAPGHAPAERLVRRRREDDWSEAGWEVCFVAVLAPVTSAAR